MTTLLQQLGSPKRFYEHFYTVLQTPRPSGEEGLIRDKIITLAKNWGLDYAVDTVGNLRVSKPASKGYENAPAVILQCHLDMVCSKTTDKVHDFSKDPIQAYINEDGFLTADRTTLGSDDGVGIAACLAIAEDTSLSHGPLQFLFTVCEETTMGGAIDLSSDLLNGTYLLNLDSEEENAICVGCAGGFEAEMIYDDVPTFNDFENFIPIEVKIAGLNGGHSGVDIDKNRGNAIKILGLLLSDVSKEKDIFLTAYTGGNARNAIPRDATATFLVNKQDEQVVYSLLNDLFINLKDEYKVLEQKFENGQIVESAMRIEITTKSINDINEATTLAATKKILSLLNVSPSGVIRWSPEVENTVDTSVNIGLTEFNVTNKQFIIYFFARSSVVSQQERVKGYLQNLAAATSCKLSGPTNEFPGWEPVISSYLVQELIATHKKLFNAKPKVYSIHAGLECGLIKAKYPHLECASIGPTILDAHSPDEKLKLSSVKPWFDWVLETLKSLK